MAIFKRKNSHEGPVNPEELPGLRAELTALQTRGEELKAEAAELYERKVRGGMHDGEYNISISAIGQEQSDLTERMKVVTRRIDAVVNETARRALGSDEG